MNKDKVKDMLIWGKLCDKGIFSGVWQSRVSYFHFHKRKSIDQIGRTCVVATVYDKNDNSNARMDYPIDCVLNIVQSNMITKVK